MGIEIKLDTDSVLAQFNSVSGIDWKKYPVRVLGVRGYFLGKGLPGVNDLGIYDDLLVSCIHGQIRSFQGSTDPGRYYLQHPLNPQGCAQLTTGLWWYQPGLHRGHPAFVQANEVIVNRLDHTGKIVVQEKGYFGINLHSGGTLEDDVGRFSAGCQVVYCPEEPWTGPWLDFYTPVRKALNGQMKLPYLLVDSLKAVPSLI